MQMGVQGAADMPG